MKTVVIDSVQSQANRFEQELDHLADQGKLEIPRLLVEFNDASIPCVTTLTAPHRIFDAIFRDSVLNENGSTVTFKKSELADKIDGANSLNATAIFETAPNSLLFGSWNSTWGNPRGAKFPRAIVSEMIGFDVRPGARAAGRMDPLVMANVKLFRKSKITDDDADYTVDPNEAEVSGKQKSPRPYYEKRGNKEKALPEVTDINHGMIPPNIANEIGVSAGWIEQISVINFPVLRQLSFPTEDGELIETRDQAARAALTTLGLASLSAFGNGGVALRSRCELVAEGSPDFEVVGSQDQFSLSLDEALDLHRRAVDRARDEGFIWDANPIVLKPSQALSDAIAVSRSAEPE